MDETKNEVTISEVLEQIRLANSRLDEIKSMLDGMVTRRKGGDVQKEPEGYDEFISAYNSIYDRKVRGDAKSKRQFNARMKEGVTFDDIYRAMVNAKTIDFHIENKFRYLTPEFFTRPDKIQMYSYVTTQTTRKACAVTTYSEMER